MTNYRDDYDEHLRATILRALEDQPDYALNAALLTDIVNRFAFSVSRDKMLTEAHWLAEQGLVTVQEISDSGVIVVKATRRGVDAALGRVVVPGVRRPSPAT